MADIPIQRREGRNIWPLLLGLLVLLAILWFVFGRRTGTTAAARADSTTVANGAMTRDSAGGTAASSTAGTAGAAGTAAAGTGSGATTLGDADIANVIHEVNAGEIAAGKIAQTKASNADVKAYAREMVQAHTALDKQDAKLSGQTAATNTAMRDSIVRANDATTSKLQSANSGAEFDKAYMDAQVQGHQNALSFLQAAQNQTKSADMKKVVDAAIPDVQKHLDRARSLQSKIGQ